MSGPDPDGRRREDLLDRATEIAPYYTDKWDPEGDDAGAALLELFAELAETVTKRVDRLPEKHRIAFYDELGFSQRPPQAARLPLSVTVADGVTDNVVVSAGTQAIGGTPERTVEILDGDGFEATPARIDGIYSVAPEEGEIYEHADLLEGDDATLFHGPEGRQEHLLHVGHAGRLTVEASVDAPTTIRLTTASRTPARKLADDLVWEFYGERDGTEDWHRIGAVPVSPGDEDTEETEEFIETVREPPGTPDEEVERMIESARASTEAPDEELARMIEAVREGHEGLGGQRERIEAILDREGWELLDPFREDDDDKRADAIARRRIDLEIDGTPTETAVDGTESKWIRIRLPKSQWGSELLDTRFGRETAADEYVPPVEIGPLPAGSVPIDALLTNDTEKQIPPNSDGSTSTGDSPTADPGEEWFYPLGRAPRRQDAFYISSEEAFTKSGATVSVELGGEPGSEIDFEINPEVAWEYWDGDAWGRLELMASVDEAVKDLSAAGSVEFPVPDDLEPTAVAGHDGHWVRARLVDGSYGRYEATRAGGGTPEDPPDPETWTTEHAVQPPAFETLEVGFEESGLQRPASHVIPKNNLAYGRDVTSTRRSRFRPFVGPPDDAQTLYLGFDRPLEDGPVPLLFDVREVQYSEGFYPRLRWERSSDHGRWERVDARDGTESLTERGIVRLTFPEATTATSRFGEERHWLRARVAGSPFERRQSETHSSDDDEADGQSFDPCGRTVGTDPPAGEPGEEPPEIRGLYPNTGWAYNVRTVRDERLGSSDGRGNQTMSTSERPVLDVELWVDEHDVLSESERTELHASESRDVEVSRGADGEITAVWVRWTEVDALTGSDAEDRHYTLDPIDGRIQFGDGNDGRIPARGRDNIRATYRTGGGANGNVPAGAIEELKTAIPFVDAVANPLPADGGADEEPVEAVVDRAPKELRDRGRAVTAADVERIARDASRRLARVECIPSMDRSGDRAPGWVTLLVVPAAPDEKPVPSVTLREEVYRSVSERAAATLVADPEQLVVRGPTYVPVSVEVDVAAAGVGSLSRLEETVRSRVAAFLHPLSGGPDGEGWAFSETPCHSELYGLLEGIDGVDHVEDLVLRFRGSDSTLTVRDGDPIPSMSTDALVHSGTHEVRARRASRTGGA